MTSKIVTRENITAAPFAPIGHSIAALAMGVWRLVVAINHRREHRMLADIGLTRSDLRDAYSEPLWRDPTSLLANRRARRTAIAAPVLTSTARTWHRRPSWGGCRDVI